MLTARASNTDNWHSH